MTQLFPEAPLLKEETRLAIEQDMIDGGVLNLKMRRVLCFSDYKNNVLIINNSGNLKKHEKDLEIIINSI